VKQGHKHYLLVAIVTKSCFIPLTFHRLLMPFPSLALPSSTAMQMQNFTLPQKIRTHISHHLALDYQYIRTIFQQEDILLLQDCPNLAILCLFASLTGHSKTVICTFWGRKFRGKQRKVLLFKSCQNRNL